MQMTWDSQSNRVGFTCAAGSYTFVYDPTAGIPAVIKEITPTGSVYYIREPNGALLARVEGENISYYHFDELGSTRLISDATGSITDMYRYDAWGNVTSHTDETGYNPGPTNQPYQYVGKLGYYTHYQEPSLGLMQLGVRFYDSEIGRFTQRDLIRIPEWSEYHYSNDMPTRKTDATGLYSFEMLYSYYQTGGPVICEFYTYIRVRTTWSVGKYMSCLKDNLTLGDYLSIGITIGACAKFLSHVQVDGGASFLQCMTSSPDWVSTGSVFASCIAEGFMKKTDTKEWIRCRSQCSGWYANGPKPSGDWKLKE